MLVLGITGENVQDWYVIKSGVIVTGTGRRFLMLRGLFSGVPA